MNINIKNLISTPHTVVVTAILALSLFFLWQFATTPNESPQDSLYNLIKNGEVTQILETRESSFNPGRGNPTEQLLEVVIEGETVTVLNDLIPVQPGTNVLVQTPFFDDSANESETSYYVVEVDRTHQLLWVAIGFIILVGLISGTKGLKSLVGLVFSAAVLTGYILPQIIAGQNPIVVGLVGSFMILLVALYVSYGFNSKSITALIGITSTLVIVGLGAAAVTGWFNFSGFGSDETVYLNTQNAHAINLIGLLTAGILIATIGALDDVAVTQASITARLASANKKLRGNKLFKEAMQVGSDHISALVNTLVLAYTGAALPMLLLLSISGQPIGNILSGEVVAQEIVRTLIASAGLLIAVPLTTLIAVWAISRK